MTYSDERLTRIFHKTDGWCEYCGKKLAWSNYGNPNGRGGWEVDHSIPLSKGGTDHLNNLVPACIPCNREKGNLTGRQYRESINENTSESEDNPLAAILIALGLIAFVGWLNKRR